MTTLNIDKQKQQGNHRLVKLRRSLAEQKNNLLSQIPGTSAFKFGHAKLAMKLVNRRMNNAVNIAALPSEYKIRINKKIRRCEFDLYYFYSIHRLTIRLIILLTFIFSFLLSYIFTIILKSFVLISFDMLKSFVDIGIGYLLFALVYLLIFTIFFFIKNFTSIKYVFVPPILLGFFSLVLLYKYLSTLITYHDVQSYHISIIVLTFSVFVFAIYTTIILVSFTRNMICKSIYTIEYLSDTLLTLLKSFERHNNSWVNLKEKQNQLLKIEEIAQCIEGYLPRRLSSNDIVTDVWLKTRAKEVATYIREKKRWIVTPKSDTNIHLIEEFIYILTCIFENNWDGLKVMKPEELSMELSRPQLLRSRITGFFRTFFIALLPIIGFVIVQLTPWRLSGPIRDYLIIGLFIWGFLTFISALDPTINTKISTIKDIISIFPSGSDRKT